MAYSDIMAGINHALGISDTETFRELILHQSSGDCFQYTGKYFLSSHDKWQKLGPNTELFGYHLTGYRTY
jgi:hypothetical protein